MEAAELIAWGRDAGYLREFSDTLTPAQKDFIHRLLAHKTPQESYLTIIRQSIQTEIIQKGANGGYRFQLPLIEQCLSEKYLI